MLRIEALVGLLSVVRGKAGAKMAAYPSDVQGELYKLLGAIAAEEWRGNLATLRRVVFLGFADDTCAVAALQYLGLRLRSSKQIELFLRTFNDELDLSMRTRLAELAGRTGAAETTKQRLSSGQSLTAAERAAASQLAREPSELAERIVPFLRGRFAPWRVPLRTALLATFSKEKEIAPFLRRAFPELYAGLTDLESIDIRRLVDRVIELAEEQDVVPALLERCIRNSNVHDIRPQALLYALRRYTEPYPGVGEPPKKRHFKGPPPRRK
jgi:hypothetical protein